MYCEAIVIGEPGGEVGCDRSGVLALLRVLMRQMPEPSTKVRVAKQLDAQEDSA